MSGYPETVPHDRTGARIDRRSLLAVGSATVLAAAFGRARWLGAADAHGVDLARPCVLTPEQSEGPFYLDLDRLRRNVKDGKRGLRLRLRLVVVDAATCKPIPRAAVDIWHADADGAYSGFAQEGTPGASFLRGTQVTNAKGVAIFETIYPGAYRGRATHVHTKVHVGGRRAGARYAGGHVVHTGQVYFPERVNDAVYALPSYRVDEARTRNAADGLFAGQGGARSILKVMPLRKGVPLKGYLGAIALGVDTRA